jgi:tetratricopeptide (TPR) repeat protein
MTGYFYQQNGRLASAEASFKKALELNPENAPAYFSLGVIYQQQGRIRRAERWWSKGLQIFDSRAGSIKTAELDRIYGKLAFISEKSGKITQARDYFDRADRLAVTGVANNDSFTARNYRALKAMLDKRKIRLVCVQYPMRPVASLKRIFAGQGDNIIFVDNRNIFRVAIGQNGLNAYFRDMFGGNFGHCTDKGNQLLGENIAKAIRGEMFGK